MFYAGYYKKKQEEILASILLSARMKPRKITGDFSSINIQNLENWPQHLNPSEAIIWPINKYFNRKAFKQALRLISQGRTILFFEEDNVKAFLTFHQAKMHSENLKEAKQNTLTKLYHYTLPKPDLNFELINHIIDNVLLTKQYLEALETQERFKITIEKLFDSLDATLSNNLKRTEILIQKLAYVLQFAKHPDETLLKEQFGDDKEFKAVIIQEQWKKALNVSIDHTKLFIDFEVEYFGDPVYLEDVIYGNLIID